MSKNDQPKINSDRELFRDVDGDDYSPSCHVTTEKGLGINVGGSVFVKPLRAWHDLAVEDGSLRAESLEQARLLGMSGSREAELLAKVARLRVALSEAELALIPLGNAIGESWYPLDISPRSEIARRTKETIAKIREVLK